MLQMSDGLQCHMLCLNNQLMLIIQNLLLRLNECHSLSQPPPHVDESATILEAEMGA